MKSEWRITSNIFNDKKLYRVYRLRDIDAVDHSGNREHSGTWATENRQEAEDRADALNKEVP